MISSKYVVRAGFLLSLLPLMSIAQTTREVPLKNWSNPMYWRANHPERDAGAKFGTPVPLTTNTVSPDALTFVAIEPCRLVDTRGAAAGFNGITPFDGPSIQPQGTTVFFLQSPGEAAANTMPAPCGMIPPAAEAYSLNLTVMPHSGGAGGYVTLWPTGTTRPVVATVTDGPGATVSNAAIVAAGTSGAVSLYNAGPAIIDVVIDMNGYFAPGVALTFADYFALMPGDNAATVAPGTDVSFPQDGSTSGSAISRLSASSFNLSSIGSYQIMFQVSVEEAGQLTLTLNGADLAYTVAGRATGTSQIVGIAVVSTTVANSILTLRNPAGNSTALTITPVAGGTRPVSAHLVITQIQ
jgi:hypothetical protein